MSKRLEITVSDETWDALDAARGHEPRASFVKRALAEMLDVEPLTPVAAAAAREAYESPALEEQFYEEPFVVAGPVTRGCPECGGDMRERDPLSGIRVCADCGLTERT